jgi:Pacifastin inhibitor (LCMII)
MEDCNTCSCDESGTLARCTAMACDPNERQKRSDVVALITTSEVPRSKPNDCVPGARWKQDCNWCWCAENGFAACTLKGCLGSHQPKFHLSKLHPAQINVNRMVETTVLPDVMTAQEAKLVESNKVKRQTRNNNETPKIENQNNQQPSVKTSISTPTPRSETTSKKPNGYAPTSGREVTEAQLVDPNFKCEPSLSFKVACNTCWCAADGKSARFCTRQSCTPKTYPTLAPQ